MLIMTTKNTFFIVNSKELLNIILGNRLILGWSKTLFRRYEKKSPQKIIIQQNGYKVHSMKHKLISTLPTRAKFTIPVMV